MERERVNSSRIGKRPGEGTAGKIMSALALGALYVRSSFYKILLVLAGMILTEGLLFRRLGREMAGRQIPVTPEKMIEGCFLKLVFFSALALAFFILLWMESQRGGVKSSYTLLRLKLTWRQQFALRTGYNILCLALVFAVQAAFSAILCLRYGELLPEEFASPQLLFLTFYRSSFLHSLLPMAEAAIWVRNLLLLLAFGMEAAWGIRGRNYWTSTALCAVTANLFAPPVPGWTVLVGILIYGCFNAAILFRVLGVIGDRELVQED